jgi:hypothetical protein
MKKISAQKRIEIAILAGQVAYTALALQGMSYDDILKAQFKELILRIKDLDDSIKKI